MVGRLRRVLMCRPDAAGWGNDSGPWREMRYLKAPNLEAATSQHEAFERGLETAGVEIVFLPAERGLLMDAVYTHDASLMTDFGVIIMRMGKPFRCGEPQHHRRIYDSCQIPIIGEIQPPGTAEAGDMIWLSEETLLVGRGYRTNGEGINQLSAMLSPRGIKIIVAPLPHGAGPSCCLHLMSLISLLDDHSALVDSPWLAVQTLELLQEERKLNLIEMVPAERDTLGCNVLALGDGHLFAIEENHQTNERLLKAGFEVHTFSGSEIAINGGGGPTCLTRPLLRR